MKSKFAVKLSKIALKVNSAVAGLAFLVTFANVNATCQFLVHQPKLPENAKKLRKF